MAAVQLVGSTGARPAFKGGAAAYPDANNPDARRRMPAMDDTTQSAVPDSAQPPLGLFASLIGVITSPKATFERLGPLPKIAGVLLVVSLLGGIVGPGLFVMTERGQQAWLDATVQASEKRSGQPISEQQITGFQKFAPYVGYSMIGGTVLTFPIVVTIEAGILYVLFTFGTGGTATFRQVMAVVAHTAVIGVLGLAFTVAMQFVQGTISTTASSPANLGALLPMLPEEGFLSHFLGLIDIFRVWALTVMAIGLGVVYHKKTGMIAGILFSIYAVIIIGVAYFFR
jgi:hypothetical protein